MRASTSLDIQINNVREAPRWLDLWWRNTDSHEQRLFFHRQVDGIIAIFLIESAHTNNKTVTALLEGASIAQCMYDGATMVGRMMGQRSGTDSQPR